MRLRWINFWLGISLGSLGLILPGLSLAAPAGSGSLAGGTQFSPTCLVTVLAPGKGQTGVIRLVNQTETSQHFTAKTADLTIGDDGHFRVKPQAASPFILGTTLMLATTDFSVPAGGSLEITYRLQLPATQEPGDYLGVLLFQLEGALIEQAVGLPIFVRLSAEPSAATLAVSYNPMVPPQLAAVVRQAINRQAVTTASTEAEAATPAYELYGLTSSRLAIFRLPLAATLRNLTDGVIDGQAEIKFRDGQNRLLATETIRAPALLKGEQRVVKLIKTALWRDSRWGRLPYLGPLQIRGRTAGSASELVAETFFVPWWAALILAVASVGLLLRLLALHPFFPHRPVRFQGRLSLAALLILAGLATVPGPAAAEQITAEPLTLEATVPAYAGYTLIIEGEEMVIATETNYYLEVITDTGSYLLKAGDELRLPVGTALIFLGVLGSLPS